MLEKLKKLVETSSIGKRIAIIATAVFVGTGGTIGINKAIEQKNMEKEENHTNIEHETDEIEVTDLDEMLENTVNEVVNKKQEEEIEDKSSKKKKKKEKESTSLETSTPTPVVISDQRDDVTPTVTPIPIVTSTPTVKPRPTETPKPTESLKPTETPRPTESPSPTESPKPTEAPRPTVTPSPTVTPRPTETPKPTESPSPTQAPRPTVSPSPTQAPSPTESPNPTETPSPTETPRPTETPSPTESPKPTVTPTPSHTHNYNKFLSYEGEKETWECTGCGETTTKNHTLGKKWFNRETSEIIEECETEGCNYTKRTEHTSHLYDSYVNSTDIEETWECVCGETTTKEHVLRGKTYDENTKEIVQACENEGCDYEKRASHPTHSFTTFESATEDGETWSCECSETFVKEHSFGEPSFDKGTHEVVEKCETKECGYEKRKEHFPHVPTTFVTNAGEYETWECECGETVSKAHTLDEGSFDKKTHEFVQKCETEDCGYEKRELHTNHTYNNFIDYDDSKENWECECGEALTKGHTLGAEYMEEGTYDYVQKCEEEECGYEVRVKHNTRHQYKLNNTDDSYEYYKCVCGDTYQKTHNYGEGVPNGDGTYNQTCTNENCGYTRNYHTCVEGDTEVVYIGTKEECYKVVYNCEICGKFIREDPPVGHNLYRDWDLDIMKCSRSGCSYTEPLAISNEISYSEEDYEEEITPTIVPMEIQEIEQTMEVPYTEEIIDIPSIEEIIEEPIEVPTLEEQEVVEVAEIPKVLTLKLEGRC